MAEAKSVAAREPRWLGVRAVKLVDHLAFGHADAAERHGKAEFRRDELDFDLQTFKYVNIAESRHRGAEAGLSFTGATVSAFASLTFQDAVARAGDNAGNQLKAIPGQLISTGVTLSPPRLGTFTLALTRMADMFIDDANTRRIPSWTRVDAQASRAFGAFDVVFGARNLFDTRINSTGFLDPSGSGEAYWYPAAGRVITLGIRHGK